MYVPLETKICDDLDLLGLLSARKYSQLNCTKVINKHFYFIKHTENKTYQFSFVKTSTSHVPIVSKSGFTKVHFLKRNENCKPTLLPF